MKVHGVMKRQSPSGYLKIISLHQGIFKLSMMSRLLTHEEC